MSYQAMAWATEQITGSAAKKIVLMMIANRACNESWSCYPSQKRIAEECELGLRTVERALSELEADGFITRTMRRKSTGQRNSDLITLNRNQPAIVADGQNQPANVTEPTRQCDVNQPATVAEKPVSNNQSLNQSDYSQSADVSRETDDWPEAMWTAYPHSGNRGDKKTALLKLGKIPIDRRAVFERWIADYRASLAIETWRKPCMMATMLNQERWKEPIDLDLVRRENEQRNSKNDIQSTRRQQIAAAAERLMREGVGG